jgi:hypothetical protein
MYAVCLVVSTALSDVGIDSVVLQTIMACIRPELSFLGVLLNLTSRMHYWWTFFQAWWERRARRFELLIILHRLRAFIHEERFTMVYVYVHLLAYGFPWDNAVKWWNMLTRTRKSHPYSSPCRTDWCIVFRVEALSENKNTLKTYYMINGKKLLSLKPVVRTRMSYERVGLRKRQKSFQGLAKYDHEVLIPLQTRAKFLGKHSTTSVTVSVTRDFNTTWYLVDMDFFLNVFTMTIECSRWWKLLCFC